MSVRNRELASSITATGTKPLSMISAGLQIAFMCRHAEGWALIDTAGNVSPWFQVFRGATS